MAGRKARSGAGSTPDAAHGGGQRSPPEPIAARELPIVGIGASAGGLEALSTLFDAMPDDTGCAFVVVAHLDPTHTSILSELIQKHTSMPVAQVEDGVPALPDHVYVIPPNRDLAILNGALQLLEPVRPRGAHLPIDTFLEALATDQGRQAVAIVLSGTGTDGTLGVKAIKWAQGLVLVQDEESAKYGGMPHSAIGTGLADHVLPPEKMPACLVARADGVPDLAGSGLSLDRVLQQIFLVLRNRTGHDFSQYKRNTIRRRIERRMHIHQLADADDYVRYLRDSEHEAGILFRELLIRVTRFFRDPEAFAVLQSEVLPRLLAEKSENETFRAWVPGCASGEEAYSIAMLLLESMERAGRHAQVQIFGTDLDADAVDLARKGRFPAAAAADLGPERLRRFFGVEEDGTLRVKKAVRELLVFAPQNLIKDPPFTRLDLLCCRNLLIYLDGELQKRLLPAFHYSLRPGGVLFLGSSETVGRTADLFQLEHRKWKIYRRKPLDAAARPVLHMPIQARVARPREPEVPDIVREAEETSVLQLVESILHQSNTPPCAVVNEACDVVYIHGRTGRYLEPAEGRASVNIVEMARPGLKAELNAAVRQVFREKTAIVSRKVKVSHDGGHLHVTLTVRPVSEQAAMRGLVMVVFEEAPPPAPADDGGGAAAGEPASHRTVTELEDEVREVRESLQAVIEELETSNEELKSTNEELQSTNEELQSTNEELETSKEELQSLNEESTTVNAELQARIDELSVTNDDLKNLLDSTEIATLFLDADLQVRRYTTRATDIIPLTATDLGRPLGDLAPTLVGVDLPEYGRQVLGDLGLREATVASRDGRHYVMRVRPYRTAANVIAGVVFTFDDISERREAELRTEAARTLAEGIVETLHEPLLILDEGLKVVRANGAFYRAFAVAPEDTEGRPLQELGNRQWDIPDLKRVLEGVLNGDSELADYRIEHTFEAIGRRTMLLNARQVGGAIDRGSRVLLAMEDITDRA